MARTTSCNCLQDKKKGKSKVQNEGKGKSKDEKCRKCGCFKNTTRKCRTPHHLIDLYQNSLKNKAETSGYEAHFNQQPDVQDKAGCSCEVSVEPSNNEPPLTVDDYMDTENTIVEFASDDLFGDLN